MNEESKAAAIQGSKTLDSVSLIMRGIVECTAAVKQNVSTVDAGSREQAAGVGQIAQSLSEMDVVTQQTAATAEQSLGLSEQMSKHADELGLAIGQMRLMVEGAAGAPEESGLPACGWAP